MKVYAFVPAKGTSERVENKNMRFLDGERLYIRALKKLLKCKNIDRVFLDTESQEMFDLVDYLPITFMKRDANLATNKTDGHQMFLNEVNSFPDADIYVQLLCTSPFIDPETIDDAIEKLKNSDEYDSAILMKRDKFYLWENGQPLYDINHIPNSKDLPFTEIESMGLYICKKETAQKLQRRYGNRPLMVYGKPHETVDVNTPEDLHFAETVAAGIRRQENRMFNLIKHFLSAPALSDLLDDMFIAKGEKCGAVINNWKCNIQNAKLLGRANTLKLRALKDNEDFRGIYDALDSYEGVAENDIIIVENECKDFAYFGDLNARLAIRSGASGVIVDGVTRDKKQTELLGLPVFARGYNAADVRRRATTESINKPIQISGHVIAPGDLIFMDENAMVVIYKKYEQEILSNVLKTFKNEKNIITDILENKNVAQITHERGAF